MNRPDVPDSQGRRSGRHAVNAPGSAVLEQSSLEQVVERAGPLTPQQAATIGLAVLDQLVAVHNRGMLHGDVRPGSVLIGPRDHVTLATPTLRSPAFTAPEGVTGPAADLWSLGATLYTAVEGRAPSPGGSLDNAGMLGSVLFALLSGDPAQRPEPGVLRNTLLDLSRNGGHTPLPPVRADAVPPPSPWAASTPFPADLPTIPPASSYPSDPFSSGPLSSGAFTSGPSESFTSGPSRAFTSGPSEAFTSGPSEAFTSGPSEAFTSGPSEAFTSGPFTSGPVSSDPFSSGPSGPPGPPRSPGASGAQGTLEPTGQSGPSSPQENSQNGPENSRQAETRPGPQPEPQPESLSEPLPEPPTGAVREAVPGAPSKPLAELLAGPPPESPPQFEGAIPTSPFPNQPQNPHPQPQTPAPRPPAPQAQQIQAQQIQVQQPQQAPAPREPVPVSPIQESATRPPTSARRSSGVLVPRPIVGLTGGLLLAMAVAIGVLLSQRIGAPVEAEARAPGPGGALFASAPRACSLLDDKQAAEVVPGFRSSEVEPSSCDWLASLDLHKPGVEKFDLSVRLVAQKQDASGVARAKQYLSGKRQDILEKIKVLTPKPTTPKALQGVGEEAFSTGVFNQYNLYGGAYRVTVVLRISNLVAEIDYSRYGVKNDSDGQIAAGAEKVARWLSTSLKTNG
ncbi:hypothetical protein [Streptosporangium sp. NPDC049376]|uniref:hypothetical protein n=1 Tax=Streptosporangium sp. NPDC049376 TaxID=3366192 RepID=UPI0037B26088